MTEAVLNTDDAGQFTGGTYEADFEGPTDEPTEPADGATAALVGAPGSLESVDAPASLELPPAVAAPDRPAYLPAKFKSPEELAAAYEALEKKLGVPAPAVDPAAPVDATKAKETAVAAGVTEAELTAYAHEVNANGKLSEASYAALAAKGLPKPLVDAHVKGLQAIRDRVMSDATATVGGAEGYKKIATWAVANLDKAAQAQYNADVNSGDPARVNYAVEGLKARHDAAVGHPSARVHGRRAPAGAQGFADMPAQVAAQSDPRYWSDPGFRAEVLRQIAASTFKE